ncbi:hypothetical protein Hanom_Chr03g00188051 [Helianthus anomalus]
MHHLCKHFCFASHSHISKQRLMLMDSRTRKLSWGLVVVAMAFVISTGEAQDYTSVVQAITAFGDSVVDFGNND